MTDPSQLLTGNIDVIVIGGGPSGLSLATELKRQGFPRVVVLEREAQAGGIPRHCGHPPFGMREFKRILTGPRYAVKLVETAKVAGVEIYTQVNVVETRPEGVLQITSDFGVETVQATRVVLATGVRETPRSARLISGTRPLGVMNTGALQSMVFLKQRKPFERPVILGTELVSFSALMTCRHANIRPQAMIEPKGRTTARWPSELLSRIMAVPLHRNTKLLEIQGQGCVTGVLLETMQGKQQHIKCDGVLLTGEFIPEASLVRGGPLELDPATGGPSVDQFGRCSDPAYFACGNVLHPVETAGWCWNEGRQIAKWVAQDLIAGLPTTDRKGRVLISDPMLKYAMPQYISDAQGMASLQLRVTDSVKGTLVVRSGNQDIWKKRINSHKERRILIPLDVFAKQQLTGDISLRIEP
jgi:thioredoxin reductase